MSSSPFLPFVAPFGAFLILTQLESLEPLRPYYPWVYVGKILLVGGMCLAFRKSWPVFSTRGLGWAVLFGVVGVGLWVLLAGMGVEKRIVESIPAMKSLFPDRVGFNPFQEIADPIARYAFLIARFIGLALIVPIIEEVFWRGFLLRYLIDDRQFNSVPVGTFSSMSFLLVTLFFGLVHPELVAALFWGAGINLLLYQTRNLWATVIAHGITNLLLGIYVLQYGAWQLW
ncbi:CAAX prenyl protease-related protein [bacterium]|nr:CAAX prenyl protease-related protein [bacterium]